MDNDHNQPQNDLPAAQKEAFGVIKLSQRLILSAAILCPASLYLPGGVLLSIAGAICVAVALQRLSKLEKSDASFQAITKRMRVMAIICLAACGVTLVMNIVALAIVYPMVSQAFETGDFSAFGFEGNPFEPSSASSGTQGSQGNSAWG